MVHIPDRDGSYAVLVGIAHYAKGSGYDDLPSVAANLEEFNRILVENVGLANVEVIADPQDGERISDALLFAKDNATDLLLFYYSGHGYGTDRGLSLTVAKSRRNRGEWSTIPFSTVRGDLRGSRAANRIAVLDCCYSGKAIIEGPMSAQSDVVRELTAVEGTMVLAATDTSQPFARAPRGATYTAFSGALFELLRDGWPEAGEFIRAGDLLPRLRIMMSGRGFPMPEGTGTNTVFDLALARNPMWDPKPMAASMVTPVSSAPGSAALERKSGSDRPLPGGSLFDRMLVRVPAWRPDLFSVIVDTKSTITASWVSADYGALVVAERDGTFWSWQKGKTSSAAHIPNIHTPVRGISVAPDGQGWVVTDSGLFISGREKGELVWHRHRRLTYTRAIAVCSCGRHVGATTYAPASSKGSPSVAKVHVLDRSASRPFWRGISLESEGRALGKPEIVCFSRDCRLLAVAAGDSVFVIDRSTRRAIDRSKDIVKVSEPRTRYGSPTGLCFDARGRHLARCSSEGYVRVWETAAWKTMLEFEVPAPAKTLTLSGSSPTVLVGHAAGISTISNDNPSASAAVSDNPHCLGMSVNEDSGWLLAVCGSGEPVGPGRFRRVFQRRPLGVAGPLLVRSLQLEP